MLPVRRCTRGHELNESDEEAYSRHRYVDHFRARCVRIVYQKRAELDCNPPAALLHHPKQTNLVECTRQQHLDQTLREVAQLLFVDALPTLRCFGDVGTDRITNVRSVYQTQPTRGRLPRFRFADSAAVVR